MERKTEQGKIVGSLYAPIPKIIRMILEDLILVFEKEINCSPRLVLKTDKNPKDLVFVNIESIVKAIEKQKPEKLDLFFNWKQDYVEPCDYFAFDSRLIQKIE